MTLKIGDLKKEDGLKMKKTSQWRQLKKWRQPKKSRPYPAQANTTLVVLVLYENNRIIFITAMWTAFKSVCCTVTLSQLGDNRNRIKNRNSGNLPEFRFRFIRNRNDFSKFWFRSIRNRIGDLKIRLRSIRTRLRKTNRDKQINRPQCPYVNNIRHVCICLFAHFECMHVFIW